MAKRKGIKATRYKPEVKDKALMRLRNGEEPVKLAKELNIPYVTVRYWKTGLARNNNQSTQVNNLDQCKQTVLKLENHINELNIYIEKLERKVMEGMLNEANLTRPKKPDIEVGLH